MPLRTALIGCRIIETADNYARADLPLFTKPEAQPDAGGRDYYDDERFWCNVLGDPESAGGTTYQIDIAAVSEWVARVPGLYWKPESERLRQLGPEAVEYKSQAWITYRPWGKSQKVMGGVGTLRLPPGQDGYRLATLTTSCNASAGVPALISPEVWEHLHLSEGAMLGGRARWQPMATGWSSHFPSTRGVPRGYLILDQPDEIELRDPGDTAPTQIHPFTVMEYYRGGVELFDYVYASADTGDPRYRQRLERFFGAYKDKQERYGRYLLAGDVMLPLWEAQYSGPEDLRRADPSAEPQLNILKARVHERHLGEGTTEDLLEALSIACASPNRVKELADEAGIPPGIWFAGGTVAEVGNQLVAAALDRGRVTALIEVVAAHYPELFQEEERRG